MFEVDWKEKPLSVPEKIQFWGYGPWVAEPDYMEFEQKGFTCRVNRCYSRHKDSISGGHLCGYVILTPDHPYYKMEKEGIPIEIHGGLTYSGYLDKEHNEWLIGFDCCHCYDLSPGPLRTQPFFKPFPDEEYRTLAYVVEEIKKMVDQLLEAVTTNPIKKETPMINPMQNTWDEIKKTQELLQ